MIKDTKTNLGSAADGEKMEWTALYSDFATVARQEGFTDVANSFDQIAKVEKFHESRYRKLAANIAAGEAFKKKGKTVWHCANCGYIYEGTEAPTICPACKHPQSYYEVLAENY